jgi:aminopeptidase N
MLISGCSAPAPTSAPAAPTSASEPSPAPVESSRAVLDACDTELQSRAMRESQVPAWDTLELNACYELTLELQPENQAYTGAARVTFANLTGGELPDIVFRVYPNARVIYGGALDITSAQIDGQKIAPEAFLIDETALRLPLAQALPAGATAVIDLTFAGRLPGDFGSGDTYGVFNYVSDGPLMTLTNCFPILAAWLDGQWDARRVLAEGDAVVSEVALYRVQLSAPNTWKVAATGSLVNRAARGGSTQYEFVSGPVRDFNVIASPAFVTQETQVGGVRIVHWGLPGGEESWDSVLEVARDSVAVFDERFGPYPYAELDVVALPLQNASGVEFPGLIVIGASLYSGDESGRSLPVTVAHEVAHQWWYAMVGNDVLNSPWQDEGLTTYSSTLYFEENDPPFYEGLLGFYRDRFSDFENEQGDEPIAQPVGAFRGRGGAYGVIVYVKGALFFDALRDQIGDDAFFGALQAYFDENQYRLVGPEALLNAFEDSCGCDLEVYYEEWGVVAP